LWHWERRREAVRNKKSESNLFNGFIVGRIAGFWQSEIASASNIRKRIDIYKRFSDAKRENIMRSAGISIVSKCYDTGVVEFYTQL
jgi:hypothetical protein